MNFNAMKLFLYLSIAIWGVAEIFMAKWMFKAKPNKNLMDKYPRKVVFLSQLPFGKNWKKYIDKDDVRLMEPYQHRIKVWFLSIIIPLLLIPFICILYIFMFV